MAEKKVNFELVEQWHEACRTRMRFSDEAFREAISKPRFAERFWSRVLIVDEGCWEWQGYKDTRGYGRLNYRRGKLRWTTGAHRIAFALTYSADMKSKYVCHHCDNPACCRPEHLFLGTNQDNLDDMKSKGRSATGSKHGLKKHPERSAKGEQHGSAKLTEEVVLAIRRRVSSGERQCRVADEMGLDRRWVNSIVKRRSWVHI